MTGNGLVLCHFGCGAQHQPRPAATVWRAIHGWETQGRRRDPPRRLRHRAAHPDRPQFACDRCIERLKPGLAPAQETLPLL